MNGIAILKQDDPQHAIFRFWDPRPTANPAIGLEFLAQWILNNSFDPFILNESAIRTLTSILKILRGLHFCRLYLMYKTLSEAAKMNLCNWSDYETTIHCLEAFMKKTFAFLFLSILLVSCASPTQAPDPAGGTRPALTDPAQPIEVQAGDVFHIVVDSNPSTGYHWDIVGEPSGVEFISSEYTADEPVIPGSGGVDVWTFNAVSAGQTQITLGSFPPGADVTEPAQTVTFNVVVK